MEKQGHPRPTGYRAYLSKIQITPSDEAQTSSTDLGDSTDRSSNTESNPATDSPIIKEKTKTTRDQRRKRANERYNNRTTMERFQRDLNRAFRANGIDADVKGCEFFFLGSLIPRWDVFTKWGFNSKWGIKEKMGR